MGRRATEQRERVEVDGDGAVGMLDYLETYGTLEQRLAELLEFVRLR